MKNLKRARIPKNDKTNQKKERIEKVECSSPEETFSKNQGSLVKENVQSKVQTQTPLYAPMINLKGSNGHEYESEELSLHIVEDSHRVEYVPRCSIHQEHTYSMYLRSADLLNP